MFKCKYIGLIVLLIAIIVVPLTVFLVYLKSDGRTNDTKLIIDHDGGADDAMAIFMALLYEQYFEGPHVLALTTTHGNVNEDQCFNNTQRILDIAQRRDVPIYRGSKLPLVSYTVSDYYFGVDGLGDSDYHSTYNAIPAQSSHAVAALIDLSKKYEGNLIIVTIGTLTNIALAIRMDPGFIRRLKHLYVAAGHIHDTDHPEPEFNAFLDVVAYHIVAEAAIPDIVTIVPFSQTNSSMDIEREWRESILGAIDTNIMRALNEFERLTIGLSATWDMLDPAAMAVVLNETVVEDTVYSSSGIILCGEERGKNTMTIVNIEEANVRVMNKMNEEVFKQMLIDIFSSQL